MPPLREIALVDASVDRGASVLDAGRTLFRTGVSAVAVLDAEWRVVGHFSDDDLIRGVFPDYLGALRHTSFLAGDVEELAASIEQVRAEPVARYMREPLTVDIDASAAHIAERFLHCESSALAVVADRRFAGMIDELRFVEEIMRRLGVS